MNPSKDCIPPFSMPDEPQSHDDKKDNKMPEDSFLDDVMYVAKEALSPTADPKNDPVPGEEK